MARLGQAASNIRRDDGVSMPPPWTYQTSAKQGRPQPVESYEDALGTDVWNTVGLCAIIVFFFAIWGLMILGVAGVIF
jgi:hypothetical protein